MLELVVPALLLLAGLTPATSLNDKRKIKTIFENTGYGISNKKGEPQYPKFRKKLKIMDGSVEIGTRYLYMIPLGLPANKAGEMEKKVGFFTDGLNRPVIVEFRRNKDDARDLKRYLTISVFKRELPDLYPYKDVPDRKGWVVPLGRTLEETIWHDFERTPHITVAGTTRFGKTVFLKVLITYLIEHHGDDAEFYIIDLKGGLEFARYESIRQIKAVASNVQEAYDVLFHLCNDQPGIYNKEGKMVKEIPLGLMQQDYLLFKKNGWNNIKKTPIKRRRFVIVDEAAQLAPEKWMDNKTKGMLGACQYFLGEITRIGGGIGYREVFCTQYPTSDTLPRQIKQNSDGKISFRLPAGYASEVAIDEQGAERLPSDVPGRALYKTHEIREFQAPFLDDEGDKENPGMWDRLAKYQIPRIMEGVPENVIEYPIEQNKTGGNITKF